MPVDLSGKTFVKIPHAVQKQASQLRAGLIKLGIDPSTGRSAKFVTQDKAQQAELDTAVMAADEIWAKHCVLILGETGTGKELLAEMIAERRAMVGGITQLLPFMPVNCAGIVDTLFESELFGHVKGAYTGALGDRDGILKSAGHGTVFLDEVGELPLNQQAKLLRAIQSRIITPVGSIAQIPIHCRFVFATNRNLARMVRAGTFREDLYYRIKQITVRTFPLRDRPADARLIAAAIVQRENWTPLEPDFDIPLRWYSRGNVRSLYNCLLLREMGVDIADINAELALEDKEFEDAN